MYKRQDIAFFVRNIEFYEWAFEFSTEKDITVLHDTELNGYVILYNTTKKGIPVTWVVDYSAIYVKHVDRLANVIKTIVKKPIGNLIYFNGSVDVSNHFFVLDKRTHPIYSNIGRVDGTLASAGIHWHVTGMDSDRFLSHFL